MQKDSHNKRVVQETEELIKDRNIIDSARDGGENPKLSNANSGHTDVIQTQYSNN